jgi:PEP-CTERM motif
MKLLALLICFAGMASAETLALVCAENDNTCDGAVAKFLATGDFSSVVGIDTTSSTPTLATLETYNAVIEWTDNGPSDPTALGNVLAQYVDAGGRLTVASYSFSAPLAVGGTISTGGYTAFTNTGGTTTPMGNLVAVVPGDPIFNGIDLSSIGYLNYGLADPGLAAGATLLATSGNGVDMIARSALGVVDVNLYPGVVSGNTGEFYDLLASTVIPEPSTLGFVGAGFFALLIARSRRRKVQS